MNEIWASATRLAELGIAVIPLMPKAKIPAIVGGLKNASLDIEDDIDQWWSTPIAESCNVAACTGSCSGGLVGIDLDIDNDKGEDGIATLNAWEREHGELPETATVETGRGGMHLYYRTTRHIKNSTNPVLGVDIRGEGGMLVAPGSVHPNGRTYEWDNHPDDYAIATADSNVLAFIEHVSAKGNGGKIAKPGESFELPEVIASGGRNDTMFRYGCSLQGKGVPDEDIYSELVRANRDICRPSLSMREVDSIYDNVISRYEKGHENVTESACQEPKRADSPSADESASADAEPKQKPESFFHVGGKLSGKVKHAVLAQELIDSYGACIIDGTPAIWTGARYAMGTEPLETVMQKLVPSIGMQAEKETMHRLLRTAPRVESGGVDYIAFENGALNLETGELTPIAKDMFLTNVIPCDYDAEAYDSTADSFLDSISCGNAGIRKQLEETIGLCMYSGTARGQASVLIGNGSNGKSTFIEVIQDLLGSDNYCTLTLQQLGQHFFTHDMAGKTANLGDDIPCEGIIDERTLSTFKRAATGSKMRVDVKNREGYMIKPYCQHIFSCNKFPRLKDYSDGMKRRLIGIPLNAKFEPGREGFVLNLSRKLKNETARRYFCRVGIEGLARVLANNTMTITPESRRFLNDLALENNSVLAWIDAEAVDAGGIVIEGKRTKDVYQFYRCWCEQSGYMPVHDGTFTKTVKNALGYDTKQEKRNGTNHRVYVKTQR